MSVTYLNTQILQEMGNKMLLLISQKLDQIQNLQYPVVPPVQPGFLRSILPKCAPAEGEPIEEVLKDTENKIFPGLTLWTHPNFFADHPSNITHSSIIAEIFAYAFVAPGFMWICSPAQTELENIVCDWMVDSLDLPEKFLFKNSGGGTIADTVSDAVFISIHVAKHRKVKELGIELNNPQITKFVGYYGECGHACKEKGLLIKDIFYRRSIPVRFDQHCNNYVIDLAEAEKVIKMDIANGLIPFWLGATVDTTATCAYDAIEELGLICQKYSIWYNVDAAYAGSSWVSPEYRQKIRGLELSDSIQVNFAKLMMCASAGTLFYVSNKFDMVESMGNKLSFEIYRNKFSNESQVWITKTGRQLLGKVLTLSKCGG